MLADKKASGGAGLYILSDTVTSPSLAAQWKAAQQNYPNAKWVQWDPVNRDSAYSASKTAFGDYFDAQYRLQGADVIVSLDADFLSGITHPGFLRLAADYASRRKLTDANISMNRLYAVESAPTTTGFKAEHRLALKPSVSHPSRQHWQLLWARAARGHNLRQGRQGRSFPQSRRT